MPAIISNNKNCHLTKKTVNMLMLLLIACNTYYILSHQLKQLLKTLKLCFNCYVHLTSTNKVN